jgi:hypothetical protein
MNRPDPPPLKQMCPICEEDVVYDSDGLSCVSCECHWDDFEAGTWDNPGNPQCSHERTLRSTGKTLRCVLTVDHDVISECMFRQEVD